MLTARNRHVTTSESGGARTAAASVPQCGTTGTSRLRRRQAVHLAGNERSQEALPLQERPVTATLSELQIDSLAIGRPASVSVTAEAAAAAAAAATAQWAGLEEAALPLAPLVAALGPLSHYIEPTSDDVSSSESCSETEVTQQLLVHRSTPGLPDTANTVDPHSSTQGIAVSAAVGTKAGNAPTAAFHAPGAAARGGSRGAVPPQHPPTPAPLRRRVARTAAPRAAALLLTVAVLLLASGAALRAIRPAAHSLAALLTGRAGSSGFSPLASAISGVRGGPSTLSGPSRHSSPSSSSSSSSSSSRQSLLRPPHAGTGGIAQSPALAAMPSGDDGGRPAVPEPPPVGAVHMLVVADTAAVSPYNGATWGEVLQQMRRRLAWTDARFVLNIVSVESLAGTGTGAADARRAVEAAVGAGGGGNDSSSSRSSRNSSSSSTASREGGSGASSLFMAVAVADQGVQEWLSGVTAGLRTALFFGCGGKLDAARRVDGYAPSTAGAMGRALAAWVPFSPQARAAKVISTVETLWERHTSDDLLFTWLVLLNEYVTPVPQVANTTKGTDLASLACMLQHCSSQIVSCVTDATCKAGLDCLQACSFNDQVCQYRCIVSYETPKFADFALCILQLHNCRGLSAEIPALPDPAPMTTWRGAPLTHEAAEALFIGWRESGPQLPQDAGPSDLRPYSWLIAAGANAAYDVLPSQHQLYSYGRGRGQMWYEPVFAAVTLDGRRVWRRRRYRVRRGSLPGTFYYSVLDNGVTSNEYWRILDCAEDLSFCLFYYSGAAAAAGLSYSGAVLATPDGAWPAAHTARVHATLARAGLEPWELTMVDNSDLAGAPL